MNIPQILTPFAEKLNEFGKNAKPCFFVINFNCTEAYIYNLEELEEQEIKINFPNFASSAQALNEKIDFEALPISFDEYKVGFDIVMKNIKYGNSFLTNYTCQTKLDEKQNLDKIFNQAKSKYKIFYKNQWVCFSPETFVQINNGKISSRPMKGTIDADIENAEQLILNDEKEIAEHYTIVDLIRNDLSIVATNVVVKDFRYIEKINSNAKNLLQVSSLIEGQLPKDYLNNLGNIICSLLPAGSISGAPKIKTLEIIKEAEQYDRGFYTGIAGYFDGANIDTCVLIRFIENKNEESVYKSGGGITCNSIAENEYQEMKNKIYVPIF